MWYSWYNSILHSAVPVSLWRPGYICSGHTQVHGGGRMVSGVCYVCVVICTSSKPYWDIVDIIIEVFLYYNSF